MQTQFCQIVKQEQISRDIFRVTFHADQIVKDASPGQFVHVKVNTGIDPLLRRPFSIHRVEPEKGLLHLLYRVVGHGTQILSECKSGDEMDVMGPLGQGFKLDHNFDHAILVAGGMGSAPIFYLLDILQARGKKISLFWGVKESCEVFEEDTLKELGVEVRFATEDGSLGCKGFVTEPLKNFIAHLDPKAKYAGFVCGPDPMMHAVQNVVCDSDIYWQTSMENHMACGIGVCVGCAVKMMSGEYQLACKEGPVFDLKQVNFDG